MSILESHSRLPGEDAEGQRRWEGRRDPQAKGSHFMDIRLNLTSHLSSVIEDVRVCIETSGGFSMTPFGVTSMYAPITPTQSGWEAGTRVETPWNAKSPKDIVSERRGMGTLFISWGGGMGQQPSGLNGRADQVRTEKDVKGQRTLTLHQGGMGVKGTGISQSLPSELGSIGSLISR